MTLNEALKLRTTASYVLWFQLGLAVYGPWWATLVGLAQYLLTEVIVWQVRRRHEVEQP